MLKNIHIQNYRGIKDLKINDFKRINLLVGDNNSGKTSVLEAISIPSPNLIIFLGLIQLREGGGIKTAPDGSSLVSSNFSKHCSQISRQFYNLNIEEPFVIEATFNDEKKLKLEARLTSEAKDFKQVFNIAAATEITEINSFVAEYSFEGDGDTLGLSSNGTGKFVGKKFANLMQFFVSDTTPNKLEIFHNFTSIMPFSNRRREIVDYLKPFEPNLKDISQVGGDDLFFDFEGDKAPISVSYMGSGFVRFLHLVLTIDKICIENKEKNIILSVDEIGFGLHYTKLQHLWKVLSKFLDKYKNVQIVTTTHSREMIAALNKVCEEGAISKDDFTVFNIDKVGDKNYVNPYIGEDLQLRLNSGGEIR